jgi:hypothetical protein
MIPHAHQFQIIPDLIPVNVFAVFLYSQIHLMILFVNTGAS